jgi:hypothetical protein
MRIGRWSMGASAIAIAAACSSTSPAPAPTPAFVDTTGQAPTPLDYPAGPYGIGLGSVLANYDFVGYPNASATTAAHVPIRFSDFYNPHAFDTSYRPASPSEDDRLFPADSGYAMAGKAKPTVLLIDLASVWCVPCNNEAKSVLPVKHALYAACGGEFLLDLHDSNTPGVTATFSNLTSWTKTYKVDYPAVIDPSFKLDALFGVNAFPTNIIVDPTTMKVVANFAGDVSPTACNDVAPCTTDADCNVCQGICNDQSATCQTDADCASGVGCGPHSCGDGTLCKATADCAAKKCTTFSFWTTYEKYLDKSRSGCTVQ